MEYLFIVHKVLIIYVKYGDLMNLDYDLWGFGAVCSFLPYKCKQQVYHISKHQSLALIQCYYTAL